MPFPPPATLLPPATGSRQHNNAWRTLVATFTTTVLVLALQVVFPSTAAAASCANEVACENQQPGNDPSEWEVEGAGDESLQGFATQMSVNRGQTVSFKIKTDASAYTIKIFRLGYYQGKGARKVADVPVSAPLPQAQPACATDPATEIYDCGTWGVSASWAVPTSAVSGVYIAYLYRADKNDESQIPFIVRNDASTSQVVFQTSDATWQAYNTYGGSDYYTGLENGRAYKVSYNRPFATREGVTSRDYLFSNEYPMLRFLEQNGYDLSYISSLDTDIRGSNLTQHKTFLSVGHDEYWSAGQRTNVENARDAGVNLAFFSGNEVYWKTRWESSEDGTNTPNRTLVCYKDTWANTPIDPVTPTATWRDPRFGDNGHGPENALTGTAYMSNDTDLPITVNSQEGKLRLWRNTPLAAQPTGASTALAPHTVGYESDEDLDNGYRPAGLIRLSTTTGAVPQYLQDFGSNTAPGTTTHHLTMYRAASNALVFGAGTVQWAWGLDQNHDGTVGAISVPMQQATVNLLSDMSADATTLSTPGVVAATKSTDKTAPTATIVTPAAGSIGQGSTVTVTGTATDAGGVVAGVEVSLDGGSSWHPATGTGSFSYTGIVSGTGASAVKARAIDDSGNIQPNPTVAPVVSNCPCSIFGSALPKVAAANDGGAVTLGVKFTSSQDGFITGLRFYKGAGNTGTHTGTLYKEDGGTALSTVEFSNETATGWQTALFPSAVPISKDTTYVTSYVAPNGHYAADSQYFASTGKSGGPLTALGSYANLNGVYGTGSGIPSASYQQTNYYVDALYSATDTTPLSVVSTSPVDGASSVPAESPISAVFSRDPIESSISLTVQDATAQPVAGAFTYDSATRTVKFAPSQPLAPGAAYTASLMASAPEVGPMASPATWTFVAVKPDAVPGVCPCSLFNDADQPTVTAANDPNSVELGMAFTADTNGQVSGVRFYKGPGNTGTHSISLWDASGNQLATAAVTTETTVGWQTAQFTAPVPVTAGATYTASYRAPVGRYSYTVGGLRTALDKAPLHTPANAGRYSYAAVAPVNAAAENYYVDPIFTVAAGVAPQVTTITPAAASTSVPVATAVGVTFDTAIQPGTAVITVRDGNGAAVPGTPGSEPLGSKASFTPSAALAAAQTYSITVSGAKNLGGTAMSAPFTSTFTTAGITACPCSLLSSSATPAVSDSGDADPISVGVNFSAAADGFITGLRFYRDAANTGTHTGTLYTSTGAVLATLVYPDAAPGWQTATFANPVPVTAGTTYVASTFMPNGRYSYTSRFFTTPVVNAPLTGTLGTYTYGGDVFPASSWQDGYYYVDVAFSTVDPGPGAEPTVPAASSGVSAVAGDGAATVTWVAAANGGSPVTKYTVTPYLAGTGQTPTVVSGSTPATAALIGGLTNGSAYTFTVAASNAVGDGPQSAPSTPVTPVAAATVPGSPSDVAATAGDGSAVVTWSAPSSNGGSQLTAYTVTPFIGTSAQASSTVSGSPPSTGTTITGLTNGSTYTFSVTATNSVGTGPASAPSAESTPTAPLSAPAAATGVTATGGNTSALVSWIAPTDGGSPITGYTITPYVGSNPQTASVVTGSPPGISTTITGLTNGVSYTFTVTATNAVGIGAASAASGPVIPATVPTAPSGVSATAGNGTATVTWTAANDGGRPVTAYTVTPYIGAVAQSSSTVNGTPPGTSATITGLTNGTAYTFRVAASNALGTGALSSASAAVTPAPTTPAAPAAVNATPSNNGATVTWTAPANGGSPITRYTITPYNGATPLTARTVTGNPPATSLAITALTNGTAYTFRVTATNAVGTSVATTSAPVTPATVPGAPTTVAATAGDRTAAVTWNAPASNGGSAVTGYTVTPYLGTVAQTPVTTTGTSASINGLTNGSAYTFRVTASNAAGTGAAGVSGSVTPGVVPAAPTAVVATAGNTTATVSWAAPANGGSAITSYRVTPYVGSTAQTVRVVSGNPAPTTLAVTSLTNGTAYTFTVAAVNSRGAGAVSAASAAVTPFVPAFVQQANNRLAAGTAITTVPAINITAGNRLVVLVGAKNAASTATQAVTDAAGNPYVRILQSRASDNTEMSVWTAPISNGGGSKPMVTATTNGTAKLSIQLLEYAGLSSVSGASAVDQFKAAAGSATILNTTAQSGATAATTIAAELALGFYLDAGSGRSLTVGSGFTSRSNVSPASDMQFLVEEQITGAAGTTVNASVGTGSGASWVVATVVFKRK